MDNSEVRKLLEEAQVAVALAATLSNPEWTDLWIRIQKYLEQNSPEKQEEPMTEQKPIQFFDSHGNLWETCSCDHQEAESFGPRYCARRLPEGPDWKEASSRGWVKKMGEWDVLVSDRGV